MNNTLGESPFSHYRVAFAPTVHDVSLLKDGPCVFRMYLLVERIPWRSEFVARILNGATVSERVDAEQTALAMPGGGWATWADRWHPVTDREGRTYHRQLIGRRCPDPCEQLEVESLLLDLSMLEQGQLAG
jgi:hypothetical protein